MFSVVAINPGLFPASHIQLMSRWAGAGREHSQTDSQDGQWNYSIQWMLCSVDEWGFTGGAGSSLLFLFLWVQILSCPGVWAFSGHSGFQGSAIADRWLAENQSSGGEKNCIVYNLFFMFILIIVIISSTSIISIYFVVSLNCLHLNPQIFPFVHFSVSSRWGEEEGWASGCLVLSCWLPG